MLPHIFQGPPVVCATCKQSGAFCAKLQQPALACVALLRSLAMKVSPFSAQVTDCDLAKGCLSSSACLFEQIKTLIGHNGVTTKWAMPRCQLCFDCIDGCLWTQVCSSIVTLVATLFVLLSFSPIEAASNFTDVDILNFALNLEVGTHLHQCRIISVLLNIPWLWQDKLWSLQSCMLTTYVLNPVFGGGILLLDRLWRRHLFCK